MGEAEGSEVIYLLLAAELAGQRGQYELALENYLKAASLTQDVKIAQRATQIALFVKNNDKALEAASRWQALAPENADALRIHAMLLLKGKHPEQALEQLIALLRLPKIDVENALIDWVKVLSTEVSKEEGLDLMRRLLDHFPRMAELHFAYALLATDKGEQRLALDETAKALSLHHDWNRARLLQAQVMSRMGDSQAARDAIQKALKNDPNNLRLRLIYSQFLVKAGNLAGGKRELDRILAKEPNNEEALLGLAMIHIEGGQDEKARPFLLRLNDSPRWKMQSFFYLGLLEARKNHLQNALQWFDKVSEGPMAFDAQVNAITALINLKQVQEARRRLIEVRKAFPQEALRLYLLEGELLTKIKDYIGAFDLLSQALEEMPGQIELLYTRALVAEQLDKPDVLEADLRAVLAKSPDDPNALNALGFTLADHATRLEEAKRYIERALDLKPGDPAILDSMGWVQYRLGDYPSALEYLRRAYHLFKDPEIGAHFGEVLWESGKRQEAKKIWQESLRKSSDRGDMKKVQDRYPQAFE